MSLDSALLPSPLLILLSLAQLAALGLALRRAPWRALRAAPQRLHLVFGALLILLLLWSIGGRIGTHATLHLMGMTTVTLLLGPALAVLTGTAALGVQAMLGAVEAPSVLASGAIGVTVPVLVTAGLLRWAMRRAPRNLFVYMLGIGFVGGGLSMLAVLSIMLSLFALAGEARALNEWASPLIVLAMFPEGFINGAVVSGLTVYKPDWLQTFDERHFLG